MPAGRPSKYNKSIQDKADDYVNGGYRELGHAVPNAAGLARHLGVNKSTLYQWAEDERTAGNVKFSDTLGDMNSEQEQLLLSGSLAGDMNATIAKLMLANHGHVEKTQQDNTSSDGSMTPKAFPTEIKITAKQEYDDSND